MKAGLRITAAAPRESGAQEKAAAGSLRQPLRSALRA